VRTFRGLGLEWRIHRLADARWRRISSSVTREQNAMRKTVINLHVLIWIGLASWISTPSYSQDYRDDRENKKPPTVSELFTPFIRNLGFVECTVVNVDTSPHNTSIQVFFNDQVPPPISGVLQPGGFWVINWALPGEFARGVATVSKGFPSDIRAMCTSKTSVDAPSGIVVQAE
jgi:hypothetical protein